MLLSTILLQAAATLSLGKIGAALGAAIAALAAALGISKIGQATMEASAGNLDLKPGDRVRHAIMGGGVIEAVDLSKKAYVVKFDSLPTSRKISFRARLERQD